MAVTVFVPTGGLSQAERKAVQRVEAKKSAYVEESANVVANLIDKGLWSTAISLTVSSGLLSQAEIARELNVMRSTVTRWSDGSAAPLDKAVSRLAKKLTAAIRASA